MVLKSEGLRWSGHEIRMGDIRNAYNILGGKSEEWKELARPRCRWEVILKEILKKYMKLWI
jgi:hypothetical protein